MRRIAAVFGALAFLSVSTMGVSYAASAEKEVGSTVSHAAHAAKSEGLKGQALAGKVHEAIDARKDAKDALKDAKRDAQAQGKETAEKFKYNKEMQKRTMRGKESKTTGYNFGSKGAKTKGKDK